MPFHSCLLTLSKLCKTFVLSYLLGKEAAAFTTFQPLCLVPPTSVSIVWSPDVRSTFSILWSSIFTLLLCAWSIQHLNVPRQIQDSETWRKSLKQKMGRVETKVKWMIIALFCPEVLVGRALEDLMLARQAHSLLAQFALQDRVRWSLIHTFYAEMGGFVIDMKGKPWEESSPLSHHGNSARTDSKGLPLIHLAKEISVMDTRKKYLKDPDSEAVNAMIDKIRSNDEGLDSRILHLTATDLWCLRKNEILSALPDVSKHTIEDKSKGDAFVKAAALVQCIWLIIQVASRSANKVALSQLEIAVLAFAACAFPTYLLSWHKPQNVNTAVFLDGSKIRSWESLGDEFYRSRKADTWIAYTLPTGISNGA